jgi:enamine deaminase RidA (YjgF/YER057c/UK114 family)
VEAGSSRTTCVEAAVGPAKELHITVATFGAGPVEQQAAEAYSSIADILAQADATVVRERVFASSGAGDAVLAARGRALGAGGPVTLVDGSSCWGEGLAGIQLHAVAGLDVSPVVVDGRLVGASFELGDVRHVHLSDLRASPSTGSPEEDAAATFSLARRAMAASGLCFSYVVRTWIYLADILDWYPAFNRVRTLCYAEDGLLGPNATAPVPASTGIAARPCGGAWCTMDLVAAAEVGTGAPVRVERLHNPRQNEATSYGSAFSRGVAFRYGGLESVHISGTAAIDESGRSVWLGRPSGQVKRTVGNIMTLLAMQGLALADVCSATVFIKRAEDEPLVREALGVLAPAVADGVFVQADVCRPELLFEIDGVAVKAVG